MAGAPVSRPTMTEDTIFKARKWIRIHIREARRTTESPIVEAQLVALKAWGVIVCSVQLVIQVDWLVGNESTRFVGKNESTNITKSIE